jgi:hypothetical protein
MMGLKGGVGILLGIPGEMHHTYTQDLTTPCNPRENHGCRRAVLAALCRKYGRKAVFRCNVAPVGPGSVYPAEMRVDWDKHLNLKEVSCIAHGTR